MPSVTSSRPLAVQGATRCEDLSDARPMVEVEVEVGEEEAASRPSGTTAWRADTQASGATASAASCHTPKARMSVRRPQLSCRSPARWTIKAGTRWEGMHRRCSVALAFSHAHALPWHWRKSSKKLPYGKCEKSHEGARASLDAGAEALPGTLSVPSRADAQPRLWQRWVSVRKRNPESEPHVRSE